MGMYTLITQKLLQTGEHLDIAVVNPLDDKYQNLVRPVISHKSANDQWHLDQVFANRIKLLQTRFYLGLINDSTVSNIMVSENNRAGIVSHVYTVPENRKKGIARLVMNEVIEDFKSRSGRFLTLSTGYDTHPYYLYHSFGFRSVLPKSGHMKFIMEKQDEVAWFKSSSARVVKADWGHWPALNVLCAQVTGSPIRNIALGHLGPRMFEGAYMSLMKNLQQNQNYQAYLLINDWDAVVGYGTLIPDIRWGNQTDLLDFFVHPAYSSYIPCLVQAFSLPPERKIQCYVVSNNSLAKKLLRKLEFQNEAKLKKQLFSKNQSIDIEIFTRFMQ